MGFFATLIMLLVKLFWLAVVGAALWGADWLAQKGYFSKAKFSKDGTPYKFDLTNWDKYFKVFAIAVLIIVALVACSSDEPAPAPVATQNCHGSYVGGYSPPEHDERIRLRNLSLANRGIAVTGDDAIDNANAGGGPPDGGIYMAGSFTFETDANCTITKGTTMVFHAYEYNLNGTIDKSGAFRLVWSGQGSEGEMVGQIEPNGAITGKFFHPAPDNFVYGVLSGTFTPAAK